MDDEPRLAILGFHKIGEPSPSGWETWYYNRADEFAGYLAHLRDHGWQVIDVATLLLGLSDPDRLPRRAALITFDDGYRSTLEVAAPLLQQFGYPATVFVLSGCVGMGSHCFDGNSREPNEPLCTWDELRQLERCGVSVQSHGVTHRAFSDLDPTAQEDELGRSRETLEERLQKPIEVFCYPYGDGGRDRVQAAELVARAGYRAACSYDGFLNRLPVSAPFHLSRLTLGRGSDLGADLAKAAR
jgi:peptidoglycan/xylan/chitin deacetylase (PgdA/CDA1 family)